MAGSCRDGRKAGGRRGTDQSISGRVVVPDTGSWHSGVGRWTDLVPMDGDGGVWCEEGSSRAEHGLGIHGGLLGAAVC